MLVREATKEFILYCGGQRQLSANKIAAYSQDLAEFGRRHGAAPGVGVSGKDLVCYVAYLSAECGLAPATVKRRLALALRVAQAARRHRGKSVFHS